MHDFFYEPAQGITKSPAEFAKGMSKGSLSLWRNSVYGVFNAASKITGSMSKGLVHLTGEAAHPALQTWAITFCEPNATRG